MKNYLSLFDYSGNWPEFFSKAGHYIQLLDLKHGHDINAFESLFNN